MTTALALLACLVTGCVGTTLMLAWRRNREDAPGRRHWPWQRRIPVARHVVIHTRNPDARSIEGWLVREEHGWLHLERAQLLADEGPAGLLGRQDVERAHVAWIQNL